MKKNVLTTLLICLLVNRLDAQIDVQNIDIVRDTYSVPHIFAKTDAEVAYGLAWAHAEDDFKTIQEGYLAGNALLSKHLGLRGAPADFIAQFIGSEVLVDKLYHEKISAAYKKVLEGYAAGLNQYAATHPKEVLHKGLFPVTPKMMLRYAQLQLFISSNGDTWVSRILDNDIQLKMEPEPMKGANTFAFNSAKTKDGATYLAINTHQPLDGPVSWYEAHLCSEERVPIFWERYLLGAPTY